MLVCWLIPEMPLYWKAKRGVIVVEHVPRLQQQDYSVLHPEGYSHVKHQVYTDLPRGTCRRTALLYN